jgi:hypothetical protein
MSLPPLVFVAGVAIIAPAVIGLLMFRQLPLALRPLTLLFGIHAMITVAQFVLAFQRINNIWTSHIYSIMEIVILLAIFASWTDSRRAKIIFWSIMGSYAIFWVLAKILFEPFNVSPVYTPTTSRVILLSGSLYTLFVVATNQERILIREPKFWFAAGFLLAYAGSLMYYGFRSMFNDLPLDEIIKLWSIHWAVSILSNILFIAGFICVPLARNTGGQLELAQ